MAKIPRVPVENQITTLGVVKIAIKFSPCSRLSASSVLNCINFLIQNFWFLIFFEKNTHCRKKFTRSILCSFGSSTATCFFLPNILYFNFQRNFQSSHLTKKETEDASKRLSSYCMGALNYEWKFLFSFVLILLHMKNASKQIQHLT